MHLNECTFSINISIVFTPLLSGVQRRRFHAQPPSRPHVRLLSSFVSFLLGRTEQHGNMGVVATHMHLVALLKIQLDYMQTCSHVYLRSN